MKTFITSDILERFKIAFNLSSDTDIARFLNISKSTISNWKGRQTIDYDLLFSKCEHINIDWLLTGDGKMLRSDTKQELPVAKPASDGQGIPLIPVEAFAGYGMPSFDDIRIEDRYVVKEFEHADFLIRVKGNSMYPKYSSGDIIACKMIDNMLFFQWNKIYAIYTVSQGVMVKRVKQAAGEDRIRLVSDNPNYDPFDVPLSDIRAIALVIGAIRVE